MPDEPTGTDAQKMIHRLRRIIGLGQLLLNFRKGLFAEIVMDMPVHVISLIADGCHVELFLRKMLHGMPFEELDPLLICPSALLIIFVIAEQLIHDGEKLSVLPIDNIHANIEPVLPYKLFPAHFGLLRFYSRTR